MSEAVQATARRERTRQRLLDAAAQVFAEVGLDAASVEAICERAGFTRGAFYSNFETKDELFLELAERVAGAKLDAVIQRVRDLEADGAGPLSPADLVARLLDVEHDTRMGVRLLSEIRNHALRDEVLAARYIAWDDAMVARVSALIGDVERASGLELRLPPDETARLFLMTWETAAQRAAIDGLDDEALCQAVNRRIQTLAEALTG